MTHEVNHPDIVMAMSAVSSLPNVTVAWSIRLADGHIIEHQADAPMEAVSTFKALLAAECSRQVEQGRVSWTDTLVIRPEDRVESSEALETMPDGTAIPLDEAVRVMFDLQ